MKERVAERRARKIIGKLRELGLHPTRLEDSRLLLIDKCGAETLREIRRLSGPAPYPAHCPECGQLLPRRQGKGWPAPGRRPF